MNLTQTDIDTFRRCILREVNMRKKVYPLQSNIYKILDIINKAKEGE